jgi:hypothetical protein
MPLQPSRDLRHSPDAAHTAPLPLSGRRLRSDEAFEQLKLACVDIHPLATVGRGQKASQERDMQHFVTLPFRIRRASNALAIFSKNSSCCC